MQKEVIILNSEVDMAGIMTVLELDVPIAEAFPKLHGEGMGSAFAHPMHSVLAALKWMWLKWHANRDVDEIERIIGRVVERALSLHSIVKSNYLREDHDSLLLHCAIIGGSEELKRKVAKSIRLASPKSKDYLYLRAWNGLLACSIHGDMSEAMEQAKIMSNFKPARQFPAPSEQFVKSFLKQDAKALNRMLKSRYKSEWDRVNKEELLSRKKMLVGETEASITVNFMVRNSNFYWPWVEAAFVSLLARAEVPVLYDYFWIPQGLVHHHSAKS